MAMESVFPNPIECLGKGFDFTCDFRLKFAKGKGSRRLVVVDEENRRDITVPGTAATIPDVSQDIRCDKGDRLRFTSDVLQFNQMSELLNQKSAIQGKIPSGYFNALFDLTGDWYRDAHNVKYLAFDGYFISLFYLHLTASHLTLQEEVKKSVPAQWDPASLTRFIQTYGTHIITGMAVGGQDVICVKQKHSSKVSSGDLRRNLENLGDFLFQDLRSPSQQQTNTSAEAKHKVPEVFNQVMQSNTTQFTSISETSSKDGLTIICSKRGGDVFKHGHSNWLQTVASSPEAILFKFVPISSLLTGIPGSGYLTHAINLYLRYKPLPEDLQCFLEFQIPRQWAPMFYELPLRHQRKKSTSPSLQFGFMSPKLHVSSTQVVSEEKPVVGLRLYLEGRKCNRLAIHVHHLSSLPKTMIHSSGASLWRGSDENEYCDTFLEPIRWKGFANVCTAVVKHDPNWLQESGGGGGVYIVTGAQLISKGNWPKNVLHLRLQYTHIANCSIRKSDWGGAPEASRKSSFLTNLSTTFSFTQQSVTTYPQKQAPTLLDSGVYPDGPPVPVRSGKLLKYVDTSEVLRGPHDAPGHWLVTAAKLVTEGGKIGLQVKFALLDY
ncbi:MACPF domain-containing protein At1g14780 isoform X1 [Vigna radiata var. radiata]|uniref:MACPF domain-containing protein At1g14780 isoform X1 n=2 Tax=Vigna radiata var. radiata TaxID=3916 RepID=A0A1S3VTL0_VIGRR|nr:MACPF domain-containing protein At1g14780 isoform X1 [Vigna radiata var. radiata]XP_014521721.1 MACPF domain-containing protein At1g14780 isoform X1 [Vigna radiata var. radiata]